MALLIGFAFLAGAGRSLSPCVLPVLVPLGSSGHPRSARVFFDGRPIATGGAGAAVSGGQLSLTSQRLYELLDLTRVQRHRPRLELEPGLAGYAFTFG